MAFVGLRVLGTVGAFDKLSESAADIVFSILSQIVIMFLIPVIAIALYKKKTTPETMTFAQFVAGENELAAKSTFEHFGFKKINAGIVGWTVVLGAAMFFFNIFVSSFFNGILSMFGHRGVSQAAGGENAFFGIWGFLISMVLIAVLPGLCEETSHRGLLLRGFANRLGTMRAVFLSSLLFGLMHLNIIQFFYAAVLGYFMALTVIATRSIWPAIILHFMNNGVSTYLSFANANGWLGGDFFTHFGNFIGGNIFVYFIFFFAAYYIITAIIHKFAREGFIARFKHAETPPPLYRTRGFSAIKYYLTFGEKRTREPLNPAEKALLFGIVFLGTVVTAMTLVWGLL
jgi:membrane protease YdiL (CAAX protease family)